MKTTYTASMTIVLFIFKDKIPTPLCSSIVYKFSCDSCNSIYVGKTFRSLFMRMEEHKGFSYRNKNPKLSNLTKYSIRHHSLKENLPCSYNNFEILDSSQYYLNFGRPLNLEIKTQLEWISFLHWYWNSKIIRPELFTENYFKVSLL